MRDVDKMTEEELRAELERIRGERAGKGRQKRAQAKTKRIDGAAKEGRARKSAKAIEEADWV